MPSLARFGGHIRKSGGQALGTRLFQTFLEYSDLAVSEIVRHFAWKNYYIQPTTTQL
jgi:hypothetical protein